MSSDCQAALGFGFKLTKKLSDEYGEVEFEDKIDADLNAKVDVMFHGDGMSDSMDMFLIIKDSQNYIYIDDRCKAIDSNNLIVPEDWNVTLSQCASKLGMSKAKIGWFLCCSMS